METTKYYAKIRILGLRNLKSSSLLDVRRAFLKLDLQSL
jgi:hypothetical protein